MERVGAALDKVRAAGKPVLTHAAFYDDDAYLLAAHASEVWLAPIGMVGVTGPGGSNLYYKGLIDKLGAQLFTSIAMSGAGPAVLVHFLATHPLSAMAINGEGLWLMVAIGLIATVAPAYCISAGIGLIGPERTAIIGNVSPLVTVGLSIGVLGEAFTVWHAAGTAMVLLGVWLFGRKSKPKRAEVEATEVRD